MLLVGFVFVAVAAGSGYGGKKVADLLIDDFGVASKNPKPLKEWEFVTDKVMKGTSTGKMEMVSHEGRNCLRMTGDVTLKKGVFIKSGIDMKVKKKYFDAADLDGVLLKVKGNGKEYAVHIYTKNTWLPWQRYQAKFKTTKKWQVVKIPFSSFKPLKLKKALDKSKIKSMDIAAVGEKMKADIYVDEVKMYDKESNYNKLTDKEKWVILKKGTEAPFTGKYDDHYKKGIYTCRQCGAKLYESSSKFKSSCGWPSFDDEIEGAVKHLPDADGMRTEIVCANCEGHLGHVFLGEKYTAKNTRHCVNSISMEFVPAENKTNLQTAIFASGCFWGVEYYFSKFDGVVSAAAGYTGGKVKNPTYEQVCTGKTGHAEAVRVVFDPSKTTYLDLAKLYFETHDFTQLNRQGPDIGTQYRSEIFYTDDGQKQVAEKLIKQLKAKGYDVKTALNKAGKFYEAEDYHQDYFQKKGKTPTCHIYKKIF